MKNVLLEMQDTWQDVDGEYKSATIICWFIILCVRQNKQFEFGICIDYYVI